MSKYIVITLRPGQSACSGCVLEHEWFGACKSFIDARVEEGLASCQQCRVVYKELEYIAKPVNQQTCTGCVNVNSSTLLCSEFVNDMVRQGLPDCGVKDIIYVKA